MSFGDLAYLGAFNPDLPENEDQDIPHESGCHADGEGPHAAEVRP